METRFVPDAPGAWLIYELGSLVLALPPEFRAAADAVAALPRTGVPAVLAALKASAIADAAPFAVLDTRADALHVALRGPATVSAGADTVTGLGAEPWLERVLPHSAVTRLTVPGGEWTLTAVDPAVVAAVVPVVAPAVVAPEPVFDDSHDITEIPDLELSAPTPQAFEPLAQEPLAQESVAQESVADEIGEHDGSTILASDLPARPEEDKTVVVDEIARLRARRSAGLAQPGAAAAAAPPPAPLAPAAPKLSLELPDGSRQPLDAVVLVGRAPSAPADAPSSRLVRLDGDGDISRNHARIALEGDTVVVTDLGSRNGTVVRVPGRPPQKLRDGEPTPVLVGTVIDFGGGVELSVRET